MLNTLNVSQTGLATAKIAVENVSNNIANENTPGYKKRVVDIKELAHTNSRFTGRGAVVDNTYRITSQYMFDRVLSESSKQNNYFKTSSILAKVEAAFKETKNSGFSSDLNRYFQAIENLRTNPNSEVYKNNLAREGKTIVNSLQGLYSSIEKTQALEKKELEANVTKVNSILREIGEINEKLGRHSVPGNDLLDKRDQLEKKLSEYVDIEVSRKSDEYELKIAGNVVVRYNTNVRDINVVENKKPQVDRFIDSTGVSSNVRFKDGVASPGDVITFKLNNNTNISVTIGSNQYTDSDGNTHNIDIDGDGNPDTVTASNYVRALAYSINNNPSTKGLVSAYNGDYVNTSNGKVDNKTVDKFLVIESNKPGLEGKFESRITVKEIIAGVEERSNTSKDEKQSKEAVTSVGIAIYDQEITLKSGLIKSQTENLSSNSPRNKLQVYKDKLDAFAKTLIDVTSQYIKTGTNEYTYGELAADDTNGTVVKLGLFSGTSVKTMTFNKTAINDLRQKDLDYLATLQTKKNLSFDGKAQDPSNKESTSFSEFFQEIRVKISSNKESSDFSYKTQKNIQVALTSSYNKIVKVDKDEELLNLSKFEAAYKANAKVITAIDEMIQTLLGLKR